MCSGHPFHAPGERGGERERAPRFERRIAMAPKRVPRCQINNKHRSTSSFGLRVSSESIAAIRAARQRRIGALAAAEPSRAPPTAASAAWSQSDALSWSLTIRVTVLVTDHFTVLVTDHSRHREPFDQGQQCPACTPLGAADCSARSSSQQRRRQ